MGFAWTIASSCARGSALILDKAAWVNFFRDAKCSFLFHTSISLLNCGQMYPGSCRFVGYEEGGWAMEILRELF